MNRPTFVLKLQSIRGDSIKALRFVLKNLLRRHGFKCISAREETSADDELLVGNCNCNRATHGDDMRKTEAYPPKYFRASDHDDNWTLTVEIEMARMEKLDSDGGQTEKLVVYFRKQRSGLVVGSVVFDQLVAATGQDDSDDWKGCTVELYRTTTQFGPKIVPCIRVRKVDAVKKSAPKKVAVGEEMPF